MKVAAFILLFLFNLTLYGREAVLICYDYRPYLDCEGGGFIGDLIIEVLEEGGYPFQISSYPFARLVQIIKKEERGVIIPLGRVYDELSLEENYVMIPFINLYRILAYNSTLHPEWEEELPSMNGVTIGFLRGVSRTCHPKMEMASFVPLKSVESGIKMLHAGRIDFLLSSKLVIELAREEHLPPDNRIRMASWSLCKMGDVGLIIHKEDKKLIEAVEKGLKRVVESGRYYKILEEGFGKGKIPPHILLY